MSTLKNSVGESIWFPAVRRDSKSISMNISNASKANTGCVKDDETGETLDLNAENDEGDSVNPLGHPSMLFESHWNLH